MRTYLRPTEAAIQRVLIDPDQKYATSTTHATLRGEGMRAYVY